MGTSATKQYSSIHNKFNDLPENWKDKVTDDGESIVKIDFRGEDCRRIQGNLSFFKSIPGLVDLRLGDTYIEGSTLDLEENTGLVVIGLAGTSISGDIQVFDAFKMLQELDLRYCWHILGDIRVFKACANLKYLRLGNTAVKGHISVFASILGLEELGLVATSVYGDVSVFENNSTIRVLQINETAVTGTVSVFESCTSLAHLNIANTSLEGDKDALQAKLLNCKVSS